MKPKQSLWGKSTTALLAGIVLLLGCACEKINTPKTDSTVQANASVQTTTAASTTAVTTTCTTTTTVTTTTGLDPTLCRPFVDENAGIDGSKPMVALTFDDGPGKGTASILDTLEAYGCHATFFVVGQNINDTGASMMQRAVDLGCEIGSHTYDHSDLVTDTPEQRDQAISMADERIFQAIGRYPYWVRPPYGDFDDAMRLAVNRPLAYWSVDTKDWKTKNAASTVSAALQYIEDGDVVLMHDIYNETAAAVQQIVPSLVQQGYQLVTLSELVQYRGVEVQGGSIVFSMHPGNPNYKDPPDPAAVTTAAETVTAETVTETQTVTAVTGG